LAFLKQKNLKALPTYYLLEKKNMNFYGIGFKGWLFCLEDWRLLLKLESLHRSPRRNTKNFYIGAGTFGMVPYP
jgi:hypothetical protein